MTVICPKCHSGRIGTRNRAKKVAGMLGTLAGASSGATGAFQGARAGFAAASIIAPRGFPYSNMAGAVIGALFGGAAGCAVGASLGEVVDDTILNNCQCLECGYCFTLSRTQKSCVTGTNLSEPDFPYPA